MTGEFIPTQNQYASKLAALDVLGDLLATTDAAKMPQRLIEEIRELTGASTVLLIIHPKQPGIHELIYGTPYRRKMQIEEFGVEGLCACKATQALPARIGDIPNDHPAKAVLTFAEVQTVLRFSMKAAAQWVGTLVLMNLPDENRLEEVTELLNHFVPLVSMALKNAMDHIELEQQAHIMEYRIKSRTQELVVANTVLRETQENRQAILKTAMDGFYRADRQGLILEVNETLCQLCGYTEQQMQQMSLADLECHIKGNEIHLHLQRIMALGQDRYETFFIRSDQSQFAAEISIQYRSDFGGQYVAFVRDITQRKISEQHLIQSLCEKETLIAELFHRTKNTIQVIRGMLILQSDQYPDNAEVQNLVNLTDDRIQAIALVHQLLYQSKDLSKISIRDYVQKLMERLCEKHSGNYNDVQFINQIEEKVFLLDVLIPLGMMINELVNNSLIHGLKNQFHGVIRISLQRGLGGYIFEYSDNGHGVPSDFDFRSCSTLGLRLIHELGEKQLMGKVNMYCDHGIHCQVKFSGSHYKARV